LAAGDPARAEEATRSHLLALDAAIFVPQPTSASSR
jgi:hypothetical protein